MKIAVIGSNGQLGADVVAAFQKVSAEPVALTHDDLDISDLGKVREVLSVVAPSIVINTAAMHHVENCERNPQRAYEVNCLGAGNLAAVTSELNAKLVHISTDYVFDGAKQAPYIESDLPAPLNVYGKTKVDGEALIRSTTEKYFIVRTSALYGKSPCRAKGGKNFVETMLKLAQERDELRVVDDEVVSPTSTAELATQIVELCCTSSYGLYHATSEGSCSWYQFAKTIFELTNTKVRLSIAGPNEFPAKVPRPKYSVLENQGLKSMGLNRLTSWQSELASYLACAKSDCN